MMKLRIMSDLHLDVNAGYPFRTKASEIFTIICGDISAYYNKTSKWLNRYVKNGVFVAGNHIVYTESGHSLQYFLQRYEEDYPLSAPLSFLNDTYKIIEDVVFVGGTLWTDYRLYGSETQDLHQWWATQYLNDFRFGKFNPAHDLMCENIKSLLKLRPEHCVLMFQKTLATIDTVCKQFPDKKIVVVTHHAPSQQSIPEQYKNDAISPAYASNLENFILDHPNIKLWCHGHIHTACDYQIGNCRIVCNPRGYVKHCENTGFKKDLAINL